MRLPRPLRDLHVLGIFRMQRVISQHVVAGADALRALPGRPHARASDGPEARQPAAVGAELLFRLHLFTYYPDVPRSPPAAKLPGLARCKQNGIPFTCTS